MLVTARDTSPLLFEHEDEIDMFEIIFFCFHLSNLLYFRKRCVA